MATCRSTVDPWREGCQIEPILATESRISIEICKDSLRWGIRNDRDQALPDCVHFLGHRRLVKPDCYKAIAKQLNFQSIGEKSFITLSLNPSCWPALSQRRAGTRVNRSLKHSVVRSVPVISNSWSWVFSHSTAWTCSLSNPKEESGMVMNSVELKLKSRIFASITCLLSQETAHFTATLKQYAQRRAGNFSAVIYGQTLQLPLS